MLFLWLLTSFFMRCFIGFLFLGLCWSCQLSPSEEEVPLSVAVLDSVSLLSPQALPLFAPPDSTFLVYFPALPQRSMHTSQVDIGTLELVQWVAADAGGASYVLSYADYPSAVLQLGSADELLQGVEQRLLKALHATTSNKRPLLLQERHQGRAFSAQAKRRHWHLQYQLYLVNNRLYQLGIHSATGPISAQDSIDFFGSFELYR